MTSIKRLLGFSAILSATGSAVLFAGDAHATINCTFGTLGSCSGTEGALTFSNFAKSGSALQDSDTITITYNTNTGQYAVLSSYIPGGSLIGSGGFTFDISAAPGYSFLTASANIDNGGTDSFTYALTNLPTSLTTTGGPVGPNNFNAGFSTTTVTASFDAQDITSSSLRLTTNPTFAPVPGPLPILGAGAMFGYSRKLRKRLAMNSAA